MARWSVSDTSVIIGYSEASWSQNEATGYFLAVCRGALGAF